MKPSEYWIEVVSQSLDEQGIIVSGEQIRGIAADVQLSHENYGMAFYSPADDPRTDEIKRLKEELKREQDKRLCALCKGVGVLVEQGPVHSSMTKCHLCNGYGRR